MLSSLPNLLTLSRIFAVPLLVGLMWQPGWLGYTLAFILFCIAGITDYFDGYLARSYGTVSKLGQFLDPIADKIMIAAVIVMLIHNGIVHGWSVIAALIILLREIFVSGLREFLAGLQVSVPVTQIAKWKTTVQLVAIGFLIAGPAGDTVVPGVTWVGIALLWIAAGLTLYTGYDYFRAGLRHVVQDE